MLLSLVAIAPGIGQVVGFLKVFKKTGGLDIVLNVLDHVLSNGIIMDAMKDLVSILKKGLKSSLMEVKKSLLRMGQRYLGISQSFTGANAGAKTFIKAKEEN